MRNFLMMSVCWAFSLFVHCEGQQIEIEKIKVEKISASFECQKPVDSFSLGAVQKAYGKLRTMRAEFHQVSYLASLDEQESSSGELFYSAPGMMRWQYEEPERQRFIVNGKTIWFYQELDRQVVVDSLDAVILSDLPISFLMGVGDLESQFRIEKVCSSRAGLVLSLLAKSEDRGGQLDRLLLLVDSQTLYPKGARIVDLASNITTIVFDKLQYDVSIDKSLFEAHWPDNIDIIDRRR